MPGKSASKFGMSRREFVRSAAAAGAGVLLTPHVLGRGAASSADELRVAFIGPGNQGRNLLTRCLKIEGIRFKAIADIWPYHQKYSENILKKYDMPVNVYTDYRELLSTEKDLDAVIISTPDWVHADQANDCMKAGLHVYCEKEMSNTIEGAASMVRTARETGKLLQVGHQRRSNPRYWHALQMIDKDKVCGRITHVNGQWNRSRRQELGWPDGKEVPQEVLEKYGYDTMDRFREWRWYRKFSGGPMADLGSHQLDVYCWFLKARPKAVLASGGLDYYVDQSGRDWYDNVLSIYEFDTAAGPVRAFYQVLNTSSNGGYYETFMGDEGTLVISEDVKKGHVFREVQAKRREWEDEAELVETMGRDAIELKIGETLQSDGSKSPETMKMIEESKKDIHQLHLENFFSAVRDGTPLSCPPEVGFETCVTVLKANEAVEKGCRIEFKASDFVA